MAGPTQLENAGFDHCWFFVHSQPRLLGRNHAVADLGFFRLRRLYGRWGAHWDCRRSQAKALPGHGPSFGPDANLADICLPHPGDRILWDRHGAGPDCDGAPIRLTYLGVSSTPVPLLEAAQAFGATKRQVLFKVELPSALPQIMAGLNQTIMLSLSMVVIAALVGASGLGVPVIRALNTVNTSLGFESGFVIVVVAIMLDRMLRVKSK